MNIVDVLAFGVGGILVYSAVKDASPIDVVKSALSGQAPTTGVSKKDGTATDSTMPPGQRIVGGTGDSPGTYTGNGGGAASPIGNYAPPVAPAQYVSV